MLQFTLGIIFLLAAVILANPIVLIIGGLLLLALGFYQDLKAAQNALLQPLIKRGAAPSFTKEAPEAATTDGRRLLGALRSLGCRFRLLQEELNQEREHQSDTQARPNTAMPLPLAQTVAWESCLDQLESLNPQGLNALVLEFEQPGQTQLIIVPEQAGAIRPALLQALRQFKFQSENEAQIINERLDRSYPSFYRWGCLGTIRVPMRLSADSNALLFLGYRQQYPDRDQLQQALRLAHKLAPILAAQLPSPSNSQLSKEPNQTIAQAKLSAHLAHDIRAPLNNISNILKLLKSEVPSREHGDFISLGMQNCECLLELVESLLEQQALKAGIQQQHCEYFDLAELGREVLDSFKVSAKIKGLELCWQPYCQSATVFADRRQIRRVLFNLLSNAIRYTPYGRIDLSGASDSADSFTLSLRDSGPGFSTAAQPYQSNGSSLPSSETSFGIGLSICRHLAELNNGTLAIDSTPGQGSCVSLTLRLAAADSLGAGLRAATPGATQPEQPPAVSAKAQILLVDDDPDYVSSLADLMEAQGLTVLRCYSVAEAKSALTLATPDLLISDDQMAGGGAGHLSQYLQSKQLSCPLVIITGSEQRKLFWERSGAAAATLLKPADPKTLISLCQNLIYRPKGQQAA